MIPSPRHPLRLCFAFSSVCVSEKEVGVDRPAVKCHIGVTEVWGTSVPQQWEGGVTRTLAPGRDYPLPSAAPARGPSNTRRAQTHGGFGVLFLPWLSECAGCHGRYLCGDPPGFGKKRDISGMLSPGMLGVPCAPVSFQSHMSLLRHSLWVPVPEFQPLCAASSRSLQDPRQPLCEPGGFYCAGATSQGDVENPVTGNDTEP